MGDKGVVELSKRQKRLERIRKNPNNVSFEELRTLLLDFGFRLERSSGSHHVFRIDLNGEPSNITIPFVRPVKAIYVRQALGLIEEADVLENGEANGDSDNK